MAKGGIAPSDLICDPQFQFVHHPPPPQTWPPTGTWWPPQELWMPPDFVCSGFGTVSRVPNCRVIHVALTRCFSYALYFKKSLLFSQLCCLFILFLREKRTYSSKIGCWMLANIAAHIFQTLFYPYKWRTTKNIGYIRALSLSTLVWNVEVG